MSKVIDGTMAITGLNVGEASHLIKPHELVSSVNGWTEKDGEWTTADSPKTLYSGYSAISAMAAGRMSGSDYVLWMDGNNLYRNGSNIGTITAGSDMDIQPLDDGFMVLGASKPYIYKDGFTREIGALQLDDVEFTGVARSIAGTDSITGITAASSAVVTTTNSIYAGVGEYIYIEGVNGMTQINGGNYEVTAVSGSGPYNYTIDLDSSTFDAYTSGGTAYGGSAGISGTYKYYLVPTVLIGSKRILGRPRGLKFNGYSQTYDANNSWEADDVALTEANGVSIKAQMFWNIAGDDLFDVNGTVGLDVWPGLRLYRTKADGTDLYLEKSWTHGNSDFTLTNGVDDYYTIDTYTGGPQDKDLGELLTYELNEHYNPPAADVGAMVGQRVYLADGEDVYWSQLDGIEYWNDLDFVKMPEVINAMGRVRDRLVMFSSDRIWVMDMSTGSPYVEEIDTPVGMPNRGPLMTTDDGLLFLRNDGLWLFDGVRVQSVARRAFLNITGPACMAMDGDTLALSGSAAGYTARVRDGGWVWHNGEAYTDLSSSNGKIYATDGENVFELYTGLASGGSLTTRLMGGPQLEGKSYRVYVDSSGTGSVTVTVNGSRASDSTAHLDSSGKTGRRITWYSIPQLMNPYASVTLTIPSSGNVVVHGVWLEVEK